MCEVFEVDSGRGSELRFVFGVFVASVIPFVSSKLVFGLMEMFGRFKDKPVDHSFLASLKKFRKL